MKACLKHRFLVSCILNGNCQLIVDGSKYGDLYNYSWKKHSVFSNIPTTSPLLQAIILKKYTAKVGFDFNSVNEALIKLDEEVEEIKQAIKNNDKENMFEEVGDALFVLANLAEKLGINQELALKYANQKFQKRFTAVEEKMRKARIPLEKGNISKMEEFWQELKKEKEKTLCTPL